MRHLGGQLGVDPMAVYHHVRDKQHLVSLMVRRIMATLPTPDPDEAWDARVGVWAIAYWDLVSRWRDLTLAGMADPAIGDGGAPATEALRDAVADSGVDPTLVDACAFIVVDAVHGSALASRSAADRDTLRELFEAGLETIVAGIRSRATGD